jgi:ubiquinone/menaquinone biosynthesis C-methylase UbiE
MDAKEAERIVDVTRQHLSSARIQAAWAADRDGHIFAERWREMDRLLTARGMVPLGNRRVLEVGCGAGGVLASLRSLGAVPDRLFGVDLVPERIELARARYPFLQVSCGNAEQMEFPDASFDLVLCFTVFSSILSENCRRAVAREVLRVLAPGGAVLWYDMRMNNPRNRNVRGLGRRDIQRLFEGCRIDLSAITLLPPLARRIDAVLPALYPLLAKLAPLRTHYLGLITRDTRKV